MSTMDTGYLPQDVQPRASLREWWESGAPWVWMNAGAVAISIVMVLGVLGLIVVKGMAHFWPNEVVRYEMVLGDGSVAELIGERVESQSVPAQRIRESGRELPAHLEDVERLLIKTGNRDVLGSDFRYVLGVDLRNPSRPEDIVAIERTEWGNQYGTLIRVLEAGDTVAEGEGLWSVFQQRLARAGGLRERIEAIEDDEISAINYRMEKLRLEERRLEIDGTLDAAALEQLESERARLDERYSELQAELGDLYTAIERDSYVIGIMGGRTKSQRFSTVVHATQPNAMGPLDRAGWFLYKIWEFITAEPREANTEGGVAPAIFGTVLMVMLMSVVVTPFGVIAAVYIREYARQGTLTQVIRIAVNNLAGVPSIVYGVFGLGFFVYLIGSGIDQVFYPEALPAPTFGTPGLLWASLTLALLTLPVVIVATEEGLTRIPSNIREGSYALGATKAETLWRTVLPMASPAMMTGLILAVARAAGEVAPLMLVGVVKLAPSLPLDGNAPFLHLDRKFMHLGFHIYDVGFQSPNVEAARPLVYATALLLVAVIVFLNLFAVRIRNRLREKYRALEH